MSIGEGAGVGFETMRGRNFPTLRQFTVFLENRVGQLLEVVRRFEGSKVRIVALSINEASECAFVRLVLSHPEQGREILERAGLALIESDLIGVELPQGRQPLLRVCTAPRAGVLCPAYYFAYELVRKRDVRMTHRRTGRDLALAATGLRRGESRL